VVDPKAATHTLFVTYRSADQVDPASLGDGDLAVTGPDGYVIEIKGFQVADTKGNHAFPFTCRGCA
jgi:hypothetical protein